MDRGFKKYNYKRLTYIFLNKIKRALWIVGKNAFLFILIFILLNMALGEFLFYRYVFLVKFEKPVIITVPTKFKDEVYQSVLKEWQVREDIFKNSLQTDYSDPFL